MTDTAGPQIPAGWFRDPGGTEQLRWWDGTAWTAHLAPIPQTAPVAPTPTAVVTTPTFTPTPTFGQAPAFTASEPETQPYVPFQNAWNSTRGGSGAAGPDDFARPAQWNTAGVWFLATSLFWGSILVGLTAYLLADLLGSNLLSTTNGVTSTSPVLYSEFSNPIVLFPYIIFLLFLFLAAIADRGKLRRLGYLKTASPFWMLLVIFAPLLYLIIRTVRVKTESGRGLAPLIFYVVSYAAIVALGIVAAVAIPAFIESRLGVKSTSSEIANATSLASGITSGMEKNGGSYSVTCTPFAKPTTSPVDVTCVAVDLSSKTSHSLQIEVDPGTNGGQPTVKLLSVTPPISQ